MKFENILDEADGFGRYQIIMIVLLVFPRVTLPSHFLLNNFIAAIPSHHCDISSLDGDDGLYVNLSHTEKLTVTIPLMEDGKRSSCQMFSEPQFHLLLNSSSSAGLPTVQCKNGWVYDNSTFKRTLATQFDLVCDKRGLTKASATIFFVGIMFGAVFFGVLCDKYGRKTMLLVSYLSAIVFSVATAFSSTFVMFAVFRFLTGFGITGISIITIVLSVEWVDIKYRTFIGVIGSISWTVGNVMLAGIAYLVTDWRILIITVTTPLVLAVATWWWIPESARWLIAIGKTDRAYHYLQECANRNGRATEFSSKIKPETLSSVVTVDNQSHNYTYLDLIRTPRMRRLTLFTGIVWYGVASTYYGISLNITGFGLSLHLTHFIYAITELPAKLLIYISLNKIGRRYSQVGTLVLTGSCILINILMPLDFSVLRSVVAILGKGLSESSFTTVFLYTTELYPTVVRQNGIGYTSFMARLGASISPLIMLLDELWKPLPEVLFCTVAISSGLVALLLPETLNVRLPEIIEDIEQPR
ncbi:solute carrier family 22 member 7-like [Chanos chanos]|uniref:Solute carrier family 22 member 6 n=1 Tax=Chanos chanos TaxID=29144 RepID=A0A6J2WHL5_CHACN|nr:solute carrier family 22 member 7-like [Chanos chanos]